MNNLQTFFQPRAVAIVGATRTPGFGFMLPVALKGHGWGDRTYLVNPKGGELHGYKVLSSVAELPDEVDLAVVIVGAERVPAVLDEIGGRGIRHVIVESAGFAETGGEGQALQAAAAAAAKRHGLRVIGPNCVGVINPALSFATVEVVPEALTPGPLGIIAQSGVFGNVLLDGLHEQGLFISKAVTLGNKMDVDECEALEYLHADPDTRVILMYLEGAADGQRLKHTLAKVCRDKPALILKSGRTAAGRAATASHTGSMAGEDALYDAVFAQTGAVRAHSLDELLVLARVFSTQPVPAGRRLGIITSSGSLGALAADAAVTAGLTLPPPSDTLRAAMTKNSPAWMNVKNPLDVGPSGLYAQGLKAIMDDDAFDMVLAITIIPFAVVRQLMPLGLTGKAWFGDAAAARDAHPHKPLVLAALGAAEFIAHMKEAAGPRVPVISSPEFAARALAALGAYARSGARNHKPE